MVKKSAKHWSSQARHSSGKQPAALPTRASRAELYGRQFYIRQLRDMKTRIMVELFGLTDMIQYAEACGFTLARAHARSGNSAVISGYLGKSDTFDKAVATFSAAYADQSEKYHAVLMAAVRRGYLEVEIEPD